MSAANDADGIHFAAESALPAPSGGGTYSFRRSETAGPTLTKRSTTMTEKRVELAANDVDERDFKKKQVVKGRFLLWLAYQSIGVIYGDIGTSPLYVYSSTFSSEPSHDDLLGALSIIIWTLTLMVSIKYVLIVLRADDEGEGGTFAIYSLLSRYANIVRRDPREERRVNMQRVKTGDLAYLNKAARSFLERSTTMKILLKVIGVFGVSLVMSDGVLTPAQSVLGAIQGLTVANESITQATIVGVTCAILVILFLIQPLGTSKIGSVFAPIVIVWLLLNFCFGVYNLVQFDHSVLKAFSPYFAGAFFVRNKTEGWKSLGGILLAFTGVEALFADLGAFTRSAIQFSWLCLAYPCLLLAYTGQAAYISRNPGAYSNPFYNSVPPGMFYPSLVIAVLAAVVASQTMITATFQLLSQIVRLSYFPQIKVIHTSKIFHQQIYIPWVNWLLMIGTICVVAAYRDVDQKLGNAYGVCVILVTFITTSMVSLVALVVWRTPIYLVVAGFLVFATLDGLFLSSALLKVPDGAWFTLALAAFLSSIFVLWRFGKENQWRAEANDKLAPWKLLSEHYPEDAERHSREPELRFTKKFGGGHVSRLSGIGIFFDKSGTPNGTPAVFMHFLQKFQAAPAVCVFFHIRPLSCPSVAPEDRFSVSRCRAAAGLKSGNEEVVFRNFYYVTIRHGYADGDIMADDLGLFIYENLRSFIIREGALEDITGEATIAIQNHDSINGKGTAIAEAEAEAAVASTSASASASASAAPNITISLTNDRGTVTENSPDPTDQESILLANYRRHSVRHRLLVLRSVYEDQVVYIIGKEQMRIGEARGLGGWARRIALAAFIWLRNNTGRRISNMKLDVGKSVEVGFVKEMVL